MSRSTSTVEETATVTSVTPYAAAKIVNKALEEAGIDKQVPPQMMYNYTSARLRKGKKPLIECNEDGKITIEGLNKWLEGYVAKQQGAAVEAGE